MIDRPAVIEINRIEVNQPNHGENPKKIKRQIVIGQPGDQCEIHAGEEDEKCAAAFLYHDLNPPSVREHTGGEAAQAQEEVIKIEGWDRQQAAAGESRHQ